VGFAFLVFLVLAPLVTTYPAPIAAYSALLGIFVPSGGSKWVIEAPYVVQAAHALRVHLGWTVACYELGEALANLVQPFWMLPVLGLFELRARDVTVSSARCAGRAMDRRASPLPTTRRRERPDSARTRNRLRA